jgi:phage terminase small subunit
VAKALNDKQKLFADAILSGNSGTAAAEAAGYSPKSAPQQAYDLLRNPKVKAYLDEKRAAAAEKAQLNAEGVLTACKEGLDFDPARMFAKNGQLLPLTEMPLEVRRNLSGMDIEEEVIEGDESLDDGAPRKVARFRTAKVRWTPRATHVAQAAKVLGMEKVRTEHELGPGTLSELLEAAMKRTGGSGR